MCIPNCYKYTYLLQAFVVSHTLDSALFSPASSNIFKPTTPPITIAKQIILPKLSSSPKNTIPRALTAAVPNALHIAYALPTLILASDKANNIVLTKYIPKEKSNI
mmetsp:Transcript_29860/g.45052  ORF Transcript_29860/g.45052 Transcript_29860/m.45052 type:complete len:106 (+) Transcript_29860:63-380(+)